MEALLQDLRYAIRTLAKSPGFALVAVLTLALGIGPNTAIFSLIYGALLKPLPYHEPDRLVSVDWQFGGGMINSVTATQYTYWKAHGRSLASAGGFVDAGSGFNLVAAGVPEFVRGQLVTADLFKTLGVFPARGRPFSAEEDRPKGPPAVIISDGLWRRDFGADPEVLGKTVRISGAEYPIVGVMPRGFVLGDQSSDLWLPMRLDPDPRDQGHNTEMIARLAPGISLAQAQGEMPGILAGLREDFPGHVGPKERGVVLQPYHEVLVADSRPTLLLLLGAVGLVLLIAVANATGLFLGRAAARRREVGVRAALGAGRWALARPLLAESLLLALAGGAVGLALGTWTLDLLRATGARALPIVQSIRLEWPVLLVTFALSAVAGVIVGVIPAIEALRVDLHESLREGDRALGGATHRMRSILVGAEVALSLVLLVSAGLLIVTIGDLWRVRPGFDPGGVWTVQASLSGPAYSSSAQVARFEDRVSAGLAALPGVRAVGSGSSLPVERGLNEWVTGLKDGKQTQTYVEARIVGGDYFGALGIPLRRGRAFTAGDGAHAPRVAVVNEALASVYWPNGDALGNPIWVDGTPCEVIGVVGDVQEFGFDQEPPRMVYVSQAQEADGMTQAVAGWFLTAWVVKTAQPLAEAQVRRVFGTADAAIPVVSVRSMDAVISNWLAPRRFVTALLELFAGLALVLAAVGLYGVVSFSVGQRRREIGLRIALGATRRNVLAMVLRQGLHLAIGGAVVGVVASLAATRVLKSLLFGVHAGNPLVLGGAAVALTIVALVACYVPSRRATQVDPMVALRTE